MFYKIGMCALATLFCSQAYAQTTYHVGVGLGPEYSGLGGTLERITDVSRLALGGGLFARSSWHGNKYGASLTYHRFDIISPSSGKHALGIGIVPVGSHNVGYYGENDDGYVFITRLERRVAYGGYLGYTYHPRTANLGGFQVAAGYVYGRRDGVTHDGLTLSFGYRFN